ncbi:MAG: OmpP1/FadL family transporter [Sphingobacteriaceae bacterium]
MKLRFLLTLTASLGILFTCQAQYASDALRFSQTQFGSTARFKGLGNAQTAIGGDLSTLGANPAGLGLFTRSEFGAGLEVNSYNNRADYLNKNTVSGKDLLNFNQVGAVFYIPALRPKGSDLKSGWISFDLGIGYNRQADYGNNLVYTGVNAVNSIADYFAELANNNYGIPSTLAGTGSVEEMAYNDYLIDYVNGKYIPETEVPTTQTRSEERSGGQNQLNLALAANYSNRFYIGLNLGFANINYNSAAQFKETGNNITEGSNYQTRFSQDQQTKGNGFNAKLGFIYKPIHAIRLGAIFESPTWYEINDSYTEVLNTDYTNPVPANTNSSENYTFTYRLRTPTKLSGGIGIFLGNNGFISADIDFVDYSKIQFRGVRSGDLSVINDNNEAVISQFKKTRNYRLGAEFKLDQLMIRGGFGIQGNPYQNLEDNRFQTKTYSVGLGYRVKNYYMDLSYQKVSANSDLKPYLLSDGTAPVASVRSDRNNIFMTFGIRF